MQSSSCVVHYERFESRKRSPSPSERKPKRAVLLPFLSHLTRLASSNS